MANQTAIEWTDLTWNPVHGCSKVSTGCAHCYAAELSLRRRLTTKPWTPDNAAENVTVKPHKLREPLSKAKEWQGLGAAAAAAGKTGGKLVFVNSTSDLFHENIPDEFIERVWETMIRCPQHTFQVLTKRPERMRHLLNEWMDVERTFSAPSCLPAPNIWLGVSIENRRYVHRVDLLRETPAAVRFISAEPLLGPLIADGPCCDSCNAAGVRLWADGYRSPELDLTGIDWLIAGGESGPKHRPMRVEWVRDLRDACRPVLGHYHGRSVCTGEHCHRHDGLIYDIPRTAFFFKQWGGARPGGEALLDGREWREFPQVAAS